MSSSHKPTKAASSRQSSRTPKTSRKAPPVEPEAPETARSSQEGAPLPSSRVKRHPVLRLALPVLDAEPERAPESEGEHVHERALVLHALEFCRGKRTHRDTLPAILSRESFGGLTRDEARAGIASAIGIGLVVEQGEDLCLRGAPAAPVVDDAPEPRTQGQELAALNSEARRVEGGETSLREASLPALLMHGAGFGPDEPLTMLLTGIQGDLEVLGDLISGESGAPLGEKLLRLARQVEVAIHLHWRSGSSRLAVGGAR